MTTTTLTENRLTLPDPETGEPVSWVQCTEQEWAELTSADSLELATFKVGALRPTGVFFRREQTEKEINA